MRRSWVCLIGGIAMVFAFDAALGAQQDKKPRKAPKQTEDRGTDAAGAELVPVERNIAGARVTLHPGGMKSAQLDESFEEAIVVTRNADGTLTQTCIHGLPLASDHVRNGKPILSARPAAPKLEVK